MPWSAGVFTRTNGTFTGTNVWNQDFTANVKIVYSRHDIHDQDLAGGIDACLNKNGQNSPTENINWGAFKITNLALGTDAGDSARFGQTITAAVVDPTSKVLTLSRADGDVTVDLTPITVAGDTSDFARKTLANNYVGINTFTAETIAEGGLRVGSGSPAWSLTGDADGIFRLNSFNTFVSAISIIPINNGIAEIWPDGTRCWTERTLDPTVFLQADTIATVTAAWSFSQSLQVSGLTMAGNGYSWAGSVPSPSTFQWSSSSGAFFKIANDGIYGSKIETFNTVNGVQRYWHNANLITSATLPVTGNDQQIALITAGADKGVWVYVAPGGWTKIAS